jgi:hypothetical protein
MSQKRHAHVAFQADIQGVSWGNTKGGTMSMFEFPKYKRPHLEQPSRNPTRDSAAVSDAGEMPTDSLSDWAEYHKVRRPKLIISLVSLNDGEESFRPMANAFSARLRNTKR